MFVYHTIRSTGVRSVDNESILLDAVTRLVGKENLYVCSCDQIISSQIYRDKSKVFQGRKGAGGVDGLDGHANLFRNTQIIFGLTDDIFTSVE